MSLSRDPKSFESIYAQQAYDNYIESLKERDTAKTPDIIHGTICCPNKRCGKIFDNVRGPYGNGPAFYNFCPHCGQRLDWDSRRSDVRDFEKIVEEIKRRKLL